MDRTTHKQLMFQLQLLNKTMPKGKAFTIDYTSTYGGWQLYTFDGFSVNKKRLSASAMWTALEMLNNYRTCVNENTTPAV